MRTGIVALVVTVYISMTTTAFRQEDQPSTPLLSALKFFEVLTVTDPNSSLRTLRTVPASEQAREAARANLPPQGALEPTRRELKKLAALKPVLIYHERDQVFDIKVVDLPQALIGLHDRAILLISRPALTVLTGSELQAAAAHELAHDFLWSQFENGRRGPARQQLEMECDGIAVLTLIALGLDPMRLLTTIKKVNHYNERFGTPSNIDDYPTAVERQQFIHTLLREIDRSRTNNPKHRSAS